MLLKSWEPPTWSSIGKQRTKWRFIHFMECSTEVKNNQLEMTLETPGKQRLWSAHRLQESLPGARKVYMQVSFCINTSSSVQSLSPVRLFVTPWTAARQASLPITNTSEMWKAVARLRAKSFPQHFPVSSRTDTAPGSWVDWTAVLHNREKALGADSAVY